MGKDSSKDGKSPKTKTKACAAGAVGAMAAAPFDLTGTTAVVALGLGTAAACGATYHVGRWGAHKTKSAFKKVMKIFDDEKASSTSVGSSVGSSTSVGSSLQSQDSEESTFTDSEHELTEAEIEAFMKDYAKLHGKLASAVTGIVLQSMISMALPSAGVGLGFNMIQFGRSLKKLRKIKTDAGERGINLCELKTDKNTAIILGVLIKVALTGITMGHDDAVSILTGVDNILLGPGAFDPQLPVLEVNHVLGRWFNDSAVETITNIAGMPQNEVLNGLGLQNVPTWHDVTQSGISTKGLLAIGVSGEVNLVANVLENPLLDRSLSLKRRV